MSKNKKGVTLDDMMAGLDDLPPIEQGRELEQVGEGSRHGFRAAAHESTAIDPKMLQSRGSTRIKLPVSQNEVVANLAFLDPRKCRVSRLNLRNQALLSAHDPAIRQLNDSMKNNGQLEPVLARPIDDPEYTHEVIYGSRRRFCAELLTVEQEKVFSLSAWVSHEVPDVDAQALARIENKDREPLSAWEYAQHISVLVEEGRTQEAIAAQEGIGRSTVAEYAAVAELPEAVLKTFVSPSILTLREGRSLARELKKAPAKILKIINTIEHRSIQHPRELTERIRESVAKNAAPRPRKPITVTGRNGRIVARISANQTKKDQYKIDLYDANEELVNQIKQLLERV